MLRKLALCLTPALALALAACSGNGSGSTGSNGSNGSSAGTNGSNGSTGSGGSSATTGLTGGTTGVNAATSTGGTNGGTNGNSTTGSTNGGDLCDPCSSNADCASGLCDTSVHQCQTTACVANSAVETDCQNANNSDGSGCASNGSCSCNVPAAICASCFLDSDCASGHCDQTNGVCVPATCSGGSDADSQACTAVGGSCQSGSCVCPPPKHDVCDYCAQDSDCTSGHCDTTAHQCQVTDCFADGGEAGTDQFCLNTYSDQAPDFGSECNAAGSCNCKPMVALCGSSFSCETDDLDCASGHADSNTCQCTTASCTGADATACISAGGTCSGASCTCPAPPVEVCGYCTADSDCASHHCDTTAHQCQVTDCLGDGGESGTDQFCLNSSAYAATYTCNTDGTCACNPLSTLCGGCYANSDCANQHCNTDLGSCDVTSCSGAEATDCEAYDGGVGNGSYCLTDGGAPTCTCGY